MRAACVCRRWRRGPRGRGGRSRASRRTSSGTRFVAPMSGRCSFPEDHRLFAGFLPAMREKIVEILGGHDLICVLGAPAFTYHVEGSGPHVPPGAQLFQLIDDPGVAAWTPTGRATVGNIRLGVTDLLARTAPRTRPLPAARRAPPRAEPSPLLSVAFVL